MTSNACAWEFQSKERKQMLFCSKCHTGLNPEITAKGQPFSCPSCGSMLEILIFPALFRETAPASSGELLIAHDEAGCFFHPHKRAVVSCHICGRFLCALCDIEIRGEHLCPACLESGKKKRKLEHLENRRILYDSIALHLAVWPALFFLLPVLFTAPVIIWMVIHYWNAPTSILGRTKIRFVTAFVLASAEITAAVLLIHHWITG